MITEFCHKPVNTLAYVVLVHLSMSIHVIKSKNMYILLVSDIYWYVHLFWLKKISLTMYVNEITHIFIRKTDLGGGCVQYLKMWEGIF